MPRPEVPHCDSCPDAVKVPRKGGGYHIYCPYIDNLAEPALILWYDRWHTSPQDCPRRLMRWGGYKVARPRKPRGPAIAA